MHIENNELELLTARLAQLQEDNERLKEADVLKTSLMHFVVHDMKGPISTVMGNLELLSFDSLTDQQTDYVNLALEDICKLQKMVLNILDITKLAEGKVRIFRDDTDIFDLARREMNSFMNMARRQCVTLQLEGAAHQSFVDELLIGRVISNLLINAIEHSRECATIIVTVSFDPAALGSVVSVADQGEGVPAEYREKIFEKFFQVQTSCRQSKTTTGLGLTFCKLAVNAHGGRIWVEENKGGGAKFVFTLPQRIPGLAL